MLEERPQNPETLRMAFQENFNVMKNFSFLENLNHVFSFQSNVIFVE